MLEVVLLKAADLMQFVGSLNALNVPSEEFGLYTDTNRIGLAGSLLLSSGD